MKENFVKTALLALILVTAVLTGVARAEIIVVAVDGADGFAPGDTLDRTVPLVLPAGARLTLLSKAGELSTLDGPYDGLIGALQFGAESDGNDDDWGAVKAFLGQENDPLKVVGASRNADGDVPPTPGVWHVSIDSSGPRCTRADALTFWRRNTDETLSLSLRNASSKIKGLAWAAGQEFLTVPRGFSIETGRMIVSSENGLRELELHVIENAEYGKSNGRLFAWLVRSGCTRQALALIKNIHVNGPILKQ